MRAPSRDRLRCRTARRASTGFPPGNLVPRQKNLIAGRDGGDLASPPICETGRAPAPQDQPMATQTAERPAETHTPEAVVVRFAGDSGDGMQLTGGQFTLSTALAGNDLATFPDFPAEIRAPQGTLFGVSAFQINFGSTADRDRRRRARRAGGDEPGGAQDQPRGAQARRADHRRHRRVHQAQPREGQVREPTRSRTAASPSGTCWRSTSAR